VTFRPLPSLSFSPSFRVQFNVVVPGPAVVIASPRVTVTTDAVFGRAYQVFTKPPCHISNLSSEDRFKAFSRLSLATVFSALQSSSGSGLIRLVRLQPLLVPVSLPSVTQHIDTMRAAFRLVALAATLSPGLAAFHQGFNYGSVLPGGGSGVSDFEAAFRTSQGLAGTNGAFSSARLYTTIVSFAE